MIHEGDCRDVMAAMAEASVDAIVTDPPYELAFMGKQWDRTGIAFDSETWRAGLRVLKPGGHLVAFGGTRTQHRMVSAIEDAGFEIRDTVAWMYGTGFPKSKNLDGDWKGWGTALKPAYEPIVLARKRLDERTVAANVLRWGTGALNIDASRITTNGEVIHAPQSDPTKRKGAVGTDLGITRADVEKFQRAQRESAERTSALGRWPANVVLDEEAASMLDAQTGERPSGKMHSFHRNGPQRAVYGRDALAGYQVAETYGDTGGASRFFYTAKPSQAERNAGLGQRNPHPTVKPISLMEWLIRLVTPAGGVVLDPFLGSGTTAIAAATQGFQWIGIEENPEYIEIARQRLGWFVAAAA